MAKNNPTGLTPKISQSEFNAMVRSCVHIADVREIVEKMVDLAKSGNKDAAKIILDRVYPVLKPETQTVRLKIDEGESLEQIGNEIFNKVARGEITPDAGAKLTTALLNRSQIAENYQNRLRTLTKDDLLAMREKKLAESAKPIENTTKTDAIDGEFKEWIYSPDIEEENRQKAIFDIKCKLEQLLYPKR